MKQLVFLGIIFFYSLTYSTKHDNQYTEKSRLKNLSNFTFSDYNKLLSFSAFRSKEELVQLFYNAYYHGDAKDIRVNSMEICKFENKIKTIFPLKHCDSIVSYDSILILYFDKQQIVPVPGTFGQAHLQLSQTLVFSLSPDVNNHSVLKFKIVDGYVRLNISKLLRIFNSSLEDLDGTELFYFADNKKKFSLLGLNEFTAVPRKDIHVSGDTSKILIDLDVPKLEKKTDIIVSKNEMKLFNIRFTVHGKDSIRVNNDSWKRDSITYQQIRYTIDSIRKGFMTDSLFPGGLLLSKSAVYQFEKKSMSISTGFNLIK